MSSIRPGGRVLHSARFTRTVHPVTRLALWHALLAARVTRHFPGGARPHAYRHVFLEIAIRAM
jgi:hypothetical protein